MANNSNTFDDSSITETDDWWDNYDGKSANGGRSPETPFDTVPETTKGYFRYVDYLTTRRGRLILEFENLETMTTALMWFNVDIRRYPAGRHGQFVPPKKGKFRRFFLYALDHSPLYWCRANRELYKLNQVLFTGAATRKKDCWELEKIVRRKRSQSAANQQPDSSIAVGAQIVGGKTLGIETLGTQIVGGKTLGTEIPDNTLSKKEKPETRVRDDCAPTMCAEDVRTDCADDVCAPQPPDNLSTITPGYNDTVSKSNTQPGDDDIEVEI